MKVKIMERRNKIFKEIFKLIILLSEICIFYLFLKHYTNINDPLYIYYIIVGALCIGISEWYFSSNRKEFLDNEEKHLKAQEIIKRQQERLAALRNLVDEILHSDFLKERSYDNADTKKAKKYDKLVEDYNKLRKEFNDEKEEFNKEFPYLNI